MQTASSDQVDPSLTTPTTFDADSVAQIGNALLNLLADHLALYVKTKNFHWHLSGPEFRDFHRAFDDQAAELLAAVDPLAERARKLGTTTLRSVGQLHRITRINDNEESFLSAKAMLDELRDDNFGLLTFLKSAHGTCDNQKDYATSSLLDALIDQAETRHWFLFEMGRA